jgi:Uma2 family endonuclease
MVQVEAQDRPVAPPRRVTYEEFLEWADEDTWAEWVDGEVIVLSPASIPHQKLVSFLNFLIDLFVEVFDLGVVLTAPTQMKLGPGRSGREPDLLFVSKEHRDRVQRTRIDGPADLVVEIVSPESVERDRVEKLAEYEAAGVPEYWWIDPDERDAAFFQLGADGRYQRVPPDGAGIYRSRVLPGFWLRVEWLWRDRPPKLGAANELGLLRRAARARR